MSDRPILTDGINQSINRSAAIHSFNLCCAAQSTESLKSEKNSVSVAAYCCSVPLYPHNLQTSCGQLCFGRSPSETSADKSETICTDSYHKGWGKIVLCDIWWTDTLTVSSGLVPTNVYKTFRLIITSWMQELYIWLTLVAVMKKKNSKADLHLQLLLWHLFYVVCFIDSHLLFCAWHITHIMRSGIGSPLRNATRI